MGKNETEKAFEEAEASLRLEGMDPRGRPFYESIRAQVIAGNISFEEGKAKVIAYHRQQKKKIRVKISQLFANKNAKI